MNLNSNHCKEAYTASLALSSPPFVPAQAPRPMSKRSRDPRDDPKSGPSKHQLRGLSYVGQKPAFLQNALTALAGGSAKAHNPRLDANGRPAIPTRPEDGPGGSDGDDDGDEQDEWDLGGGDEAPTVVVLKEGKHLDRDEVDRLRAQGEPLRAQVVSL